jgi:hypothetical protein
MLRPIQDKLGLKDAGIQMCCKKIVYVLIWNIYRVVEHCVMYLWEEASEGYS